jgi:beta-lactamase superfamily II metal-dependent hydrolase
MPSAFAGYPAPFIFDTPGGTKTQQLIWGDFVTLLAEDDGDWTKVRSRRTTGWMKKADLQEERLLEVNFVDIGQGDGTFIVTPDDRFMLIDAGEADNMFRFLSWRFNLRNHPDRVITIPTTVMTHPDQDHYKGLTNLFKSEQFQFGSIYHSGLVERAGSPLLGPRIEHQGRRYCTEVILTDAALRALLADPQKVGTRQYPKMLKVVVDAGRVVELRGLSSADGHLPGFEADKPLAIEVIAPVHETVNGAPALRWFGDDGPTKNGHSVVLRFVYGNVSVLLGGDLNISAEDYLLGHYTGMDPKDESAAEALVGAARSTFQADVAKACHHGSADFREVFLRCVNPIATVVSSGDNESHAHPRPDALGAIGKHGRGRRPLIFSTELARSTKENIKSPHQLREQIIELIAEVNAATTDSAREAAQARLDAALAKLERSVAVYGLINLRTDGTRAILAQKLERPRPTTTEEWDVHRLEPDADGELHYVSKH